MSFWLGFGLAAVPTYLLLGYITAWLVGTIKRTWASDWVGLVSIFWPVTWLLFLLGTLYLVLSIPFRYGWNQAVMRDNQRQGEILRRRQELERDGIEDE